MKVISSILAVMLCLCLLSGPTNAGGPDVILGELDNTIVYAQDSTFAAMAIATISCNAGDEVLKWEALPSNQHPVISMNLYRLDNNRIEQIGQSWVKHGFYTLEGDVCNLGCIRAGSNGLGVGCSDPYNVRLNRGPDLASRKEINPFTGYFDGSSANNHKGHNHSNISHGLQVLRSDLGMDGARYFVEGHYISSDDAIAGNGTNNTSYREVSIKDSDGSWVVSNVGFTERGKPAIYAWEGANFSIIDTPDDGRIIVATKVNKLDDQKYRYEFAVYNMNSERGVRLFRIPIGMTTISNIGFKAVFSHDEPWSNAPWKIEQRDGYVTWSTDRYDENEKANAIRWGTTYNFWFDSTAPTITGDATLGRFKPGAGSETLVASINSQGLVLSGENSRPAEELSEEGRLIVGRGKDYQPSAVDPQLLFTKLKHSMQERRKFAWKIVEDMLSPHPILLAEGRTPVDVPMWQTWYEGMNPPNETGPLLKLFFDKLKANPNSNKNDLAEETLEDFGKKKMSEALINERFKKILLQFEHAEGLPAEFGGRGFTLFSPSFMAHVMTNSQEIETCRKDIPANRQPPSDDNFSHCFKEFPRSAVMVKAQWENLSENKLKNPKTDADVLKSVVSGSSPTNGTWPSPTATESPDDTQIYTNVTKEGTRWGLAGIHFVTKDVREWVWVSLWWSPNPRQDFGADMPQSIKQFNRGVWQNYKMCVVSSFEEGDPEPWEAFAGNFRSLGDSIKATYNAIKGTIGQPPHDKITTWCSNPFIETHQGNGRTSCIGCHQFSQTDIDFGSVIQNKVPQVGRSKFRINFPSDFSWGIDMEFSGANGAIQRARKEAGFEWPNN